MLAPVYILAFDQALNFYFSPSSVVLIRRRQVQVLCAEKQERIESTKAEMLRLGAAVNGGLE
jgi:hypothetical protein